MQPGQVRVLVVDDEPNIVSFLELGLQNGGFKVRSAQDGFDAVVQAKEFLPHVVVLDIMMPGLDGFEVCNLLKKMDKMGIIMLTAKEEIDDRVKALNLGADDYMIKPFSLKELIARIHARVRNLFPELLGQVVQGPFRIDDARREIHYKDDLLELSRTEYELLKFLVMNHDFVMSKNSILDAVWGNNFTGDENVVEVYIRSLREKLEDHSRQLIRTLRGSGYRLILK
ncbi:response regulator transcription factor [Paenibacillus arenilitoris]|uniref:response regulator transcription factor n=1 Tax=Paenibacillus arenilitoris TaxID=2772299 RepID=UPI001CC23904|nr:response regulator transcription factor [Paenibacillus arenilitoris]